MIDIYHGDCLEIMATLDANSIDAIVTDPPYGLAFMGKRWDYDVPSVAIWAECLRVLKPGGHLLAFAGTRTQHRMAVRIEDAGFEIRDMIAWVYGSGFPKSLDVSKAIDKAAGAEREVLGYKPGGDFRNALDDGRDKEKRKEWIEQAKNSPITAPATEAARQWHGWGTALKPALEPITFARKPLVGTVAENVLAHGTGALNVDGCRVVRDTDDVSGWSQSGSKASENRAMSGGNYARDAKPDAEGRWPANLIHDGSEEVVTLFPMTESGSRRAGKHRVAGGQGRYGEFAVGELPEIVGDSGSAARFFYCAKASKADRDEGCEGLAARTKKILGGGITSGDHPETAPGGGERDARNHHPTVKPTDLMRYLCRLVTPPGGVVLDPFMGSGSTGKAAMLEGFGFIGIEREADYVEIARARCKEGGLLANAW
jgi:site-specific DNA-methyltransferase (adenine-specific)